MGLFDSLTGIQAQHASGATPTGDAGAHFEQVAQAVAPGTLAHGVAAAMRSDQTPPFAQMVSQLFASGSGDQKMAMLNTLLSAASPEQRALLQSTRDRFLGYRDRCPNRQCIADSYVGRMREIRDIMEGRWQPRR